MRTITEPAREIEVIRETDVLVIGGGPAGIGASVAAARMGAKVVLVERYGCLGGLATGGLVVWIPASARRVGGLRRDRRRVDAASRGRRKQSPTASAPRLGRERSPIPKS